MSDMAPPTEQIAVLFRDAVTAWEAWERQCKNDPDGADGSEAHKLFDQAADIDRELLSIKSATLADVAIKLVLTSGVEADEDLSRVIAEACELANVEWPQVFMGDQ